MLEGIQTFCHRTPEQVGIDIVVIVSEHTSELTEFWKFRLRIFRVERIAEFSRDLANSLEASFERIPRLVIGGELLSVDILHVGTNPRYVFEDIAQALFGVARRHGFRRDQRFERRGI